MAGGRKSRSLQVLFHEEVAADLIKILFPIEMLLKTKIHKTESDIFKLFSFQIVLDSQEFSKIVGKRHVTFTQVSSKVASM